MLAVVDDKVVAVAAHVGQRAIGYLVGRKHSRRLVPQANGAALGELRQARPHHAAPAERVTEVVRPSVHDRAVAEINAVMQVGDGRADDPVLDFQAVSTCHAQSSSGLNLRFSPSDCSVEL
jgi:hypothetical protein